MEIMNGNKARKANKRNIQVTRLQQKFIALCWNWMGQNQADKLRLAKHVALPHSRISELLLGSRALSMYYVGVFVRKGVFSVAEIYDNKPESSEEREEWEVLQQNEDAELQKEMLHALKGSLSREAAIQFFRSHQSHNSNIIKIKPTE